MEINSNLLQIQRSGEERLLLDASVCVLHLNAHTELIFGATGATAGRVKFLSAVKMFTKHQELLSNLPKAKVTSSITFDA